MEPKTEYFTECIQTRTPVVFAKYGDGEYNAAIFSSGANCDRTPYTQRLGNCMRESFQYLSTTQNAYLGLLPNPKIQGFWESLTPGIPIKWAIYHSIFICPRQVKEEPYSINQRIQLYKTIKDSPLKKIVICNPLLKKIERLLNTDHMVTVDIHNWFELEYDRVINEVKQIMGKETQQCIVLTCCGMGAKVLIADLHKEYPNNLYLDCGSAFDFICTKRDSRGGGQYCSYEQLRDCFLELLPEDWEDVQYEELYKEANHKLGCHFPR